MTASRSSYGQVLRHPVAGRLTSASVVSLVGDYVGEGALLVLAYQRTGLALGSAAVFGAAAVAAFAVGIFGAAALDRLDTKRGMVVPEVVGAAAVLLPLLVPGYAVILLAAACLGVVRAVKTGVRARVMAQAVDDRLRTPLVGLLNATGQAAQVLGYLTGGTIAALAGATSALLLDSATFVLAALVLRRLPVVITSRPRAAGSTRSVRGGWEAIREVPHLRRLAILVWLSAAIAAVPEALAVRVAGGSSRWLPFVLAAGPLGQVLGILLAGRFGRVDQARWQLAHLTGFGAACVLTTLASSPISFAIANLLVGAGAAWLVGPQLTFLRDIPRDRMGQVTGTMLSFILASEGLGLLVLASIADTISPQAAYGVGGAILLSGALLGFRSPAVSRSGRLVPEPAA